MSESEGLTFMSDDICDDEEAPDTDRTPFRRPDWLPSHTLADSKIQYDLDGTILISGEGDE